MKTKLKNLIKPVVSGVWGEEESENMDGINVIRAANFNVDGSIDFSNLVRRSIPKERHETGKLHDDDIIIEKSGGGPNSPVGRVAYFIHPNDSLYLSNNFTSVIRADNTKVYPKYLFYKFQHLYISKKVLKYQNQTTGLINLKLDRYLSEEIDLPELDYQIKVSTQLDQVRDLIDKRKKSITILRELLNSIFLVLFFENPESKNWNYQLISKHIVKKQYGTSEPLDPECIGFPVLRMNNLTRDGSIDLKDLKYRQFDIATAKKYELIDRDVIFNRTNSLDLVGKTAVWMNGPGYTFAGYLVRFSFKHDKINPFYFSGYMNSKLGKEILYNKAKQSGNMANISATLIANQLILVPPIDIQNYYEQIFLEIESQKLILNESLEYLNALFQSTLEKSFIDGNQIEIDEADIFEDLVKNLEITDLKNNTDRLKNLIDLFKSDKFSHSENYNATKLKLFKLIEDGIITQKYHNKHVELTIHEAN